MKKIAINYSKYVPIHLVMPFLKQNFEINISDTPDFYIYCFNDPSFLTLPKDCIKISFSMEDHTPNFNYCDYAIGTHRITFGSRYFRYPFAYAHADMITLSLRRKAPQSLTQRKFCNFIYSNTTIGNCVKIRERFCNLLSEYKHVDCPGISLNNMQAIVPTHARGWEAAKLDFIKNYKFTIAFENNASDGYITEKLSHPMLMQSLPIYYGADDVNLDFNEYTFINVKNFNSLADAIDRIIYLDNNDEEYLKYFSESYLLPYFNYNTFKQEFDNFIYNIFSNPVKYTSEFSIRYDQPARRYWQLLNSYNKQILLPLSKIFTTAHIPTDTELYSQNYGKGSVLNEYDPQYMASYEDQINKLVKVNNDRHTNMNNNVHQSNSYSQFTECLDTTKKQIKIRFEAAYHETWIRRVLEKYYTIIDSNEPDFIFSGCINNEFLYYKNEAIKIFSSPENSFPDFNYYDYAIGTPTLNFGKRYFWFPYSLSCVVPEDIENPIYREDLFDRKFCNFVYSNMSDWEAIKIRNSFFTMLSRYRHIDAPGKSMNNMVNCITPRYGNGSSAGKINFIKNYKFTIAFENAYNDGYITENLTHAFLARSVPIYYGAQDVTNYFNSSSFINCRNFESFDDVIEYIKFLDSNKDEYLKIANARPFSDSFSVSQFNESFEQFLINIIESPVKYTSISSPYFSTPSNVRLQVLELINDLIICPLLYNDKSKAVNFLHDLEGSKYRKPMPSPYLIPGLVKPLSENIKRNIRFSDTLKNYYNVYDQSNSAFNAQRFKVWENTSWRKGCSLQGQGDICWISTSETANLYRSLLALLAPYDKANSPKVRIGPRVDGGCVMPDPGTHGIALSFGVSTKMGAKDRDYELAERGFRVFQFDSKFSTSPRGHQNITFIPKKLSGSKNIARDEISFAAALECAGLAAQQNALLFLDLEGGEWELFESMADSELSLFTHVHAEFHGLANKDVLPRRMAVFDKILRIHYLPTHLHYHNCAPILGFEDFLVSGTMEITFSRRNFGDFILSGESYPTALDVPNSSRLPDVHIGVFSLFQTGESSPASVANLPSVICDCNFMNAWFALAPGLSLNVPALLGKRADLANVLADNPSSAPQKLLFWLWRCGIIEMPELTKLKPQLGHILKELHSIPYAEDALPGYTMLVHSLWLTRPDLKSLTPDLSYGQAAILMWFNDNAVLEYGLESIIEN